MPASIGYRADLERTKLAPRQRSRCSGLHDDCEEYGNGMNVNTSICLGIAPRRRFRWKGASRKGETETKKEVWTSYFDLVNAGTSVFGLQYFPELIEL